MYWEGVKEVNVYSVKSEECAAGRYVYKRYKLRIRPFVAVCVQKLAGQTLLRTIQLQKNPYKILYTFFLILPLFLSSFYILLVKSCVFYSCKLVVVFISSNLCTNMHHNTLCIYSVRYKEIQLLCTRIFVHQLVEIKTTQRFTIHPLK
jgi:hypothetical protein